MPPRSTKAPKSVMFFTPPRRIWPTSISRISFSFIFSRSSSITRRRRSVDLDDLALDGLPDVLGDVAAAADGHLGGGEKHGHADIDQQPALDLPHDAPVDDVALGVRLDDALPAANPIRLPLGEDHQPRVVLHRLEQHLDPLADRREVVAEFRRGSIACLSWASSLIRSLPLVMENVPKTPPHSVPACRAVHGGEHSPSGLAHTATTGSRQAAGHARRPVTH